MRILKSKLFIALSIYVVLFLSTLILTYAYYVNQQTRGIIMDSGSFGITVLASFDEVEITENSPYYDAVDQVILVNAYDETSINYIGKLNISIEVIPEVAARMRLQIQDEWQLTRTFFDENGVPTIPVVESVYHSPSGVGYYPFSSLKTSGTFLPIYGSDSYAYIDEVMNKNKLYRYDVIQGGDSYPVRSNDIYVETCIVRLGLVIDVIQANRYVELWGLDTTFFN